MSHRLRRTALLAVSSLTVAACLPRRDNGADPSIRPSAVLTVATGGYLPYGAPGADAAPVDGCVDTPDVATSVFSRATCLHLSAAGSSDPQGDDTIATYRFALVTATAGEGVLLPEQVIVQGTDSTMSAAVFPASALRAALLTPGDYQARLDVLDVDGHRDVILVPVRFENARPIAVPPSPRFVNSWGAAWTTDGTFDFSQPRPITIHFSAAGSFDPDGDPLEYCWKNRLTQEDLGCQGDPEIAVAPAVANSSGKLVLELHVDDGPAESLPVLATAVLDSSPTWAFENDTTDLKVLDGRRSSFLLHRDAGVLFREALALDVADNPTDSILYYVVEGSESSIARRALAHMCEGCGPASIDMITLPVEVVTNFVHEAGSDIAWAIGVTGGSVTAHVLDANDFAGYSEPRASYDLQDAFFTDNRAFAKLDRAGRLWVGSPFSQQGVSCLAFSAAPDAITSCGTLPVEPGYLLAGIALRDAGSVQEVWALQTRNFLTGEIVRPQASVMPTTGGAPVPIAIRADDATFDPDFAYTLEFVESNLGWINFFGEGLASVELCQPDDPTAPPPDAGPIDPARPPALCVRTLSEFEATFDTLSDPATGTFVGLGLEGHSLNRMTLGGEPTRIVSPARFSSLVTVDGSSGVWSIIELDGTGNVVLNRGRGSGLDGTILSRPIGTTLAEPKLDYASGDVWVGTLFPPAAARHSSDGSRTDSVTAVRATDVNGDDAGAAVQLVLPGVVAPDPQSGNVWAVASLDPTRGGGQELFLFDPYAARDGADPSTAKGVPGLPVPLVSRAEIEATGEVILEAAVQPQTGHLVILTATTAGLAGAGVQSYPSQNYYLRRVLPAAPPALPPVVVSDPVLVVSGFVQPNGSDRILFARDLSSGDVCIGYRDNGSPDTVFLKRFRADLGQEIAGGSVTEPGNVSVTDLAADPKHCWLTGVGGLGSGAVWLLEDVPAGDIVHSLRVKDTAGNPIAFERASTIRPVVDVKEVQLQLRATRFWMGGGNGAPVRLYNLPTLQLPATAILEEGALPLSSPFELRFVQH